MNLINKGAMKKIFSNKTNTQKLSVDRSQLFQRDYFENNILAYEEQYLKKIKPLNQFQKLQLNI